MYYEVFEVFVCNVEWFKGLIVDVVICMLDDGECGC